MNGYPRRQVKSQVAQPAQRGFTQGQNRLQERIQFERTQQVQDARNRLHSFQSRLKEIDRRLAAEVGQVPTDTGSPYDTSSSDTGTPMTTTTPTAPPPPTTTTITAGLNFDLASLQNVYAGAANTPPTTFKGNVVGGYSGTSAMVRVWRADPTYPTRKLTDAYGNEMLIVGLSLPLVGPSTTFVITLPVLANSASPLVATVTDSTGYESMPVAVPYATLPPVPTTSLTLDPASLKNTYTSTANTLPSNLTGTILGGVGGSSALLRVWQANPANPSQKWINPATQTEQLIIGISVPLTGPSSSFILPLSVLPGPSTPYVITVSDPANTFESQPYPVPAPMPPVTPATGFSLDPASLKNQYANNTNNTSTILTGNILGGAGGVTALVRVWQANPANPALKWVDPATGAEKMIIGVPIFLTGSPTGFVISLPSVASATNPLVVTVSDQANTFETAPLPVPIPTLTAGPPLNIDPASLRTTLTNNLWTISGNVVGGAPGSAQAYVRVWQAILPYPGTVPAPGAIPPVVQKYLDSNLREIQVGSTTIIPTGGAVAFTVPNVPAPSSGVIYGVTVTDSTGVESQPYYVPPPTTTPQNLALYVVEPRANITVASDYHTIIGYVTGVTGPGIFLRLWQLRQYQQPTSSDAMNAERMRFKPRWFAARDGIVPFAFSARLIQNAPNYFALTASRDPYGPDDIPPVLTPIITHHGAKQGQVDVYVGVEPGKMPDLGEAAVRNVFGALAELQKASSLLETSLRQILLDEEEERVREAAAAEVMEEFVEEVIEEAAEMSAKLHSPGRRTSRRGSSE